MNNTRKTVAVSSAPPKGIASPFLTGGAQPRPLRFISGQLGIEADGTSPASMEDQARLAWRNVGAQLQAAGMGFNNLVKITMLIPDASEIPASQGARLEALGDHRPASTIILAGLANPSWKIEIEAVACA